MSYLTYQLHLANEDYDEEYLYIDTSKMGETHSAYAKYIMQELLKKGYFYDLSKRDGIDHVVAFFEDEAYKHMHAIGYDHPLLKNVGRSGATKMRRVYMGNDKPTNDIRDFVYNVKQVAKQIKFKTVSNKFKKTKSRYGDEIHTRQLTADPVMIPLYRVWDNSFKDATTFSHCIGELEFLTNKHSNYNPHMVAVDIADTIHHAIHGDVPEKWYSRDYAWLARCLAMSLSVNSAVFDACMEKAFKGLTKTLTAHPMLASDMFWTFDEQNGASLARGCRKAGNAYEQLPFTVSVSDEDDGEVSIEQINGLLNYFYSLREKFPMVTEAYLSYGKNYEDDDDFEFDDEFEDCEEEEDEEEYEDEEDKNRNDVIRMLRVLTATCRALDSALAAWVQEYHEVEYPPLPLTTMDKQQIEEFFNSRQDAIRMLPLAGWKEVHHALSGVESDSDEDINLSGSTMLEFDEDEHLTDFDCIQPADSIDFLNISIDKTENVETTDNTWDEFFISCTEAPHVITTQVLATVEQRCGKYNTCESYQMRFRKGGDLYEPLNKIRTMAQGIPAIDKLIKQLDRALSK